MHASFCHNSNDMLVSVRTSICLFPSEPQYVCFRQNLSMLVSARTSSARVGPRILLPKPGQTSGRPAPAAKHHHERQLQQRRRKRQGPRQHLVLDPI